LGLLENFQFLAQKVDFPTGNKGEIWQTSQMVSESSFNTLDGWGISGEGVLNFETAKTDWKNTFWSF